MEKVTVIAQEWAAKLKAEKRSILVTADGETFNENFKKQATIHADSINSLVYVIDSEGKITELPKEAIAETKKEVKTKKSK